MGSCLVRLLRVFLRISPQCSGLLHIAAPLFCSVCSMRHFPCCCSDLRGPPNSSAVFVAPPPLLLPVLCLFLVGFSYVFHVFIFPFALLVPVLVRVSFLRCRCGNNSRLDFSPGLLFILHSPPMGGLPLVGIFYDGQNWLLLGFPTLTSDPLSSSGFLVPFSALQ